ncbi:hypothetical protein UPYG_G00327150 [Umbra pygmaea]|uniref:Muscular LMNA-interacting protein n=1 Tax=Umbra pygmaea TaxID=75934 RepID=A0ABD0W5T9_UMBPY
MCSNMDRCCPLDIHEQCLDVKKCNPLVDGSNENAGLISTKDVSSKVPPHIFVPVLKTLPIKSTVIEAERTRLLTNKSNENLGVPNQKTTKDTMSKEGLYQAEVVYVGDSERGGLGDRVQQETSSLLKSPAGHRNPPPTPINVQAENTVHHFVSMPATMETAVNKHQSNSGQQCLTPPVGAELSSGLLFNRASESDDRLSPTNSMDLCVTPNSSKSQSRESLDSESWGRDRSWSGLRMSPYTSLVSLSGAVSPCSSVRSGMFTPSLLRVKRHTLEPGSSLVNLPSACLLPSCESLSSSPCPLSPRLRHRPPPTRLSLLTAILRKGRLPVLSPALTLQRPYTPCWPIHQGTSCRACSAASSVAPIPLAPSSRAQSSASVHSPAQIHGHRDGCGSEPLRCVTAPQSKDLSTSWRKIGPHSPPLLHSKELKLKNQQLSARINSPSSQSHLSPPVPHLPQPHNLPRSVDCVRVTLPKVPSPTKYLSHSRLIYTSPEPHRNSVNTRLHTLSPETKPAMSQETSLAQDSNQPLSYSLSRLQSRSPSSPSSSKLITQSPESVNTPTRNTQSFKLKPINPIFVQALNSHLHSKLSSLSCTPADSKTQVTSGPQVSSMRKCNNQCPSTGTHTHYGTLSPPLSSPLPYSSLSRLNAISPQPSSLSYCASEGHISTPSHSPSGTVSPAPRHTHTLSLNPLQNGLKTPHSGQQLSASQAYMTSRLTSSWYTAPGRPSPEPTHSTPDPFTLSLSPAPTEHTPSPPHSLRSTPSPCLWRETSDSIDKRRKPHKIKLSYKALAAIPTNSLLLDQQAIDDKIDKYRCSQDPLDRCLKEDTHLEMCSPEQLRQQSQDLYSVIDEVLEDPIPLHRKSPAPASSRESVDKCGLKHYPSLPKPLGRETKYATFNLQPYERKLTDQFKTKPGVIRPAKMNQESPEVDDATAFYSNPFKQYLDKLTVSDQTKHESPLLRETKEDGNLALKAEKNTENITTDEEDNRSVSSLVITESEELNANPTTHRTCHGGATSFNSTKRHKLSDTMVNTEDPSNLTRFEKITIYLICTSFVE